MGKELIPNEIKDLLAKANGRVDKRCDDVIRERVAKKFRVQDELALLRKTVGYILEIIAELHEGEIDTEKFKEYYSAIEEIIAETKKEYSLGTEDAVAAELGKEKKERRERKGLR